MTINGSWKTTVKTPMGEQTGTLELETDGSTLTGTQEANGEKIEIYDGAVDGNAIGFKLDAKTPMPMTITVSATVDGDTMTGEAKAGMFPPAPLNGERL